MPKQTTLDMHQLSLQATPILLLLFLELLIKELPEEDATYV